VRIRLASGFATFAFAASGFTPVDAIIRIVIIDPRSVDANTCYKILVNVVIPRPIAFVSTISTAGVLNVAPFSFFNAFCGDPPIVGFSPNNNPPKDTLVNARATGEFVVNIVTEEIAEQMNLTAKRYPPDVNEFEISGLTPAPSTIVRPPRVLESPVNLECRLTQIVDLSSRPEGNSLVLGEVVCFHVDDAIIDARYRIDSEKLHALGRLGGTGYAKTRDRLHMTRPE
jgi:flavin reductase (DIM6/NTAB) family NADH-FMN oxidoreductase RutF